MIHHGRALLNYQGEEDGSNLDKPLVFGPAVNKFHDRQTVAKVDPSMLNTSQKKPLPLRRGNADRRDLMVIKNKWDFLGDSRQKRRNVKRKERNPKTRRKIEIKQQNGTLDDQFYCPSYFNKTEATRYLTRKKCNYSYKNNHNRQTGHLGYVKTNDITCLNDKMEMNLNISKSD